MGQLLFGTLIGVVVGVISGLIFRPLIIGYILGVIVGLRMIPITSRRMAARNGAIMGAIMSPTIAVVVLLLGRIETSTAIGLMVIGTTLWGGFLGAIIGLILQKVFELRKSNET